MVTSALLLQAIIGYLSSTFLIPLIRLFLNQLEFQIKPRFCSARKPFNMTLGMFTEFFLPVIFITTFYFYIYCYINKLDANVSSSNEIKQKYKLNKLSHRFYRHRNYKNEKLLR
ncbi:unnamed protein product [Rotaria magnacalcarata]|uniref:Uncharacterized protein n=2 Tax=Rotaria magnacalcarata TaxID=392030 RepID=A0A8S2ZMT3_9BILA|nr:unnamed protein product [Rotaria magnacalcarata]